MYPALPTPLAVCLRLYLTDGWFHTLSTILLALPLISVLQRCAFTDPKPEPCSNSAAPCMPNTIDMQNNITNLVIVVEIYSIVLLQECLLPCYAADAAYADAAIGNIKAHSYQAIMGKDHLDYPGEAKPILE
jgi:hypothetical protein